MDDTRTTLVGLLTAMLLAILAGLIAQLFVDEQRVESRAGEATYASVTQTIESVMLTATAIPIIVDTATPVSPTPEPSNYDLLYTIAREEWPLIAYEPFETNERGWSEGIGGDRSRGERSMQDGIYRWEMTAIESFTWTTAPLEAPFSDFFVEVEMRKRGVTSGSQNVTFRYNDGDNYFDFGVCQDGESYQVWRQFEGAWKELIECTPNEHFRPNETNRLAVLAQIDRYHLYVNGHYLTTIEDSSLVGGSVGVSVDLDQDQTNVFEFDNLEVRAPIEGAGR